MAGTDAEAKPARCQLGHNLGFLGKSEGVARVDGNNRCAELDPLRADRGGGEHGHGIRLNATHGHPDGIEPQFLCLNYCVNGCRY